MEIASKYEIAAANLAIALQTDTVSVEQRSELRAAIGNSIDKLVDALNMIIVCYNKRMYAGEIAPEKPQSASRQNTPPSAFPTWSHMTISPQRSALSSRAKP